ncbi:hypothetical protein ASAP_3000 [Asaia bogorensis]|uniref:Uncharacterized protein n=1 Tax=Asaia bogorensis TaxID=91915 RepID=A0A060QJB2_9PROT|nr:hypothetical protein ASAP_3000 [Asaia bogorensis]
MVLDAAFSQGAATDGVCAWAETVIAPQKAEAANMAPDVHARRRGAEKRTMIEFSFLERRFD